MKFLDIIIIAVSIGGICVFMYMLFMIQTNKFDNSLVERTLNDNIIYLLDCKKYTEESLKYVKWLLSVRIILFTVGIIVIGFSRSSSGTSVIIIALVVGSQLILKEIEYVLEKDFDSWSEKNEE